MRTAFSLIKARDRLRKKRLDEITKGKLAVLPCNCKHNQEVEIQSVAGGKAHICMLADPRQGSNILPCEKAIHAQSCMAYCPIFRNAEEVLDNLLEEHNTPEKTAELFPEASMLDWVLDKDMRALEDNPPDRTTRFLFWVREKIDTLLRKMWLHHQNHS